MTSSYRRLHVQVGGSNALPDGSVSIRRHVLPDSRWLGEVPLRNGEPDLLAAEQLAAGDGWTLAGEWRRVDDGYDHDLAEERRPAPWYDPAATGGPHWPQT